MSCFKLLIIYQLISDFIILIHVKVIKQPKSLKKNFKLVKS